MANMQLVVQGGASFAQALLLKLAGAGILVASPPVIWNKHGRFENAPTQVMRLSAGRTGESAYQIQTSDLEGAARGLMECRAALEQLIATVVGDLAQA
jgi:hypothetical protein